MTHFFSSPSLRKKSLRKLQWVQHSVQEEGIPTRESTAKRYLCNNETPEWVHIIVFYHNIIWCEICTARRRSQIKVTGRIMRTTKLQL